MDGTGQDGRHEQRGRPEEWAAGHPGESASAGAPARYGGGDVGAVYAMDAEMRDPFIWPSIEALAAVLDGVVAKRSV